MEKKKIKKEEKKNDKNKQLVLPPFRLGTCHIPFFPSTMSHVAEVLLDLINLEKTAKTSECQRLLQQERYSVQPTLIQALLDEDKSNTDKAALTANNGGNKTAEPTSKGKGTDTDDDGDDDDAPSMGTFAKRKDIRHCAGEEQWREISGNTASICFNFRFFSFDFFFSFWFQLSLTRFIFVRQLG